jgi:transcription initiation factor TFIID subunit 7
MASNRDQILGEWKFEEEFVLRVRDSELANRIRNILRDKEKDPGEHLKIVFEKSNYNGVLKFEGKEYQLTVLNLPGVTECYKSYDDVHFVKTGDVGQVLIVGDLLNEEASSGEVKDGITPPMRNARQRVFREPINVSKDTVQNVEDYLFSILDVRCLFIYMYRSTEFIPMYNVQGGAAKGYRYQDTEEVWEIDEATGKGHWVPAKD